MLLYMSVFLSFLQMKTGSKERIKVHISVIFYQENHPGHFLFKELHMAWSEAEGHSFHFLVVQMVIGIQGGPSKCI